MSGFFLFCGREGIRVPVMSTPAHTILNLYSLFCLLKTRNDFDFLQTKNPDEKSSGL
ncbi:hypothetical protein N9Q89_06325 [Flavobacteriaceae bacterium]|nr:hypothetical protein [Flavobacteriaceae bacterium]